jgi:transglutaminase-like putative cysteine protease
MSSAPRDPYLATHDVDWQAIGRAQYEVRQTLCYEYPGPIEDVHQLLMLVPAERIGAQRLLGHLVEVFPAARPRYGSDSFGNRLCHITLPRVEKRLEFVVTFRVERLAEAGTAVGDRDELQRFIVSSPLTEPWPALHALARELARQAEGPADLVDRINGWVFGHIRYTQGATGVRTTAQDVYALRQGVCQDYAHLMIALCRLARLPARYVSGHLLGEGAMHAWVQVLLPESAHGGRARWQAFDPTHGRPTDISYITVALGRDFGDVSPTRGSFRAPYGGQLAAASKQAGVLLLQKRL